MEGCGGPGAAPECKALSVGWVQPLCSPSTDPWGCAGGHQPALLCDSDGDAAPEGSEHSSDSAAILAGENPFPRELAHTRGMALWTGRAGLGCWVPTTKGRTVTPQQILRTGLSRGSHTSPLPLCPCPGQGGLSNPHCSSRSCGKMSSIFQWPGTDSEWKSKHSRAVLPTGELELKFSPRNIPAAALLPLESRKLGVQDPVCIHTRFEVSVKLQRARELGEAQGREGGMGRWSR